MSARRKAINPRSLGLATRAIHGSHVAPYQGPVTTPIAQTSTYRFQSSDDAVRYAAGDPGVYVYTRYHNPTVRELEERLALIMGCEKTLVFASGMAAITSAIFSLVRDGDEIVSTTALYGGTYRFFRDSLPNHGVGVRFVDHEGVPEIGRMITRKTRIVYFETPTNPTLAVIDIRKLVAAVRNAGRRAGAKPVIMLDNTFATTLNQDPFSLGVDAVVESGTKYLGGHSDLMAGVVAGSETFIAGVHGVLKHLGGCADPLAAFLLLRSLKTFDLRVERQNRNALELATFLEGMRGVKRVIYPGLRSHPDHRIAKKQMAGFGGMVTIEVAGGVRSAVRVCDALRIAVNAMSLGGVETLVSIPVYSSHINMKPAELKRHGVTPGMIRISTGIEHVDDLKKDFREAIGRR
ncbi:MAG: aminotransferase class I/II-fold pyridoxal phosphate-dependent enzyme [Ignavibacteria bacterium]|nr:aminotransferase class I/II-fold pyridoxal phosphate-dependent enzyme [Ignavibacteria bacterium]